MEFNEEKQDIQDDDYVDIYSKKAIFWFSIFNFLYGGILLIINLWVAGYKKAVAEVAAFLIFVQLTYFLVIKYCGITVDEESLKKAAQGAQLPMDKMLPILEIAGITIAFHIVAAIVLSSYFFKKYFPDDDYYPKPVFRPLLIYIILALLSRFMI
jgi:hypothetical protein